MMRNSKTYDFFFANSLGYKVLDLKESYAFN
jgi:hypothetical protein